jgi:hypothetical protein
MPEGVFRGNLGSKEEALYPGEKNWYWWSMANWGTKWDCYDVNPIEINSSKIKVEYITAWTTPDKWLENVSKLFPNLTFTNHFEIEGGNGEGRIEAKNGKVEEIY